MSTAKCFQTHATRPCKGCVRFETSLVNTLPSLASSKTSAAQLGARRLGCSWSRRTLLSVIATKSSEIAERQRRAAQATRETGAIPRSATTWENNPLVEFSRTACGDERVCKALDLLEQHEALDPNLLLLCIWLPWAQSGALRITNENVRNFVDVANRWRPRVFGALRIAHASMGAEDVAGLETAQLMRQQIYELMLRTDVAGQSALFELACSPPPLGIAMAGASAQRSDTDASSGGKHAQLQEGRWQQAAVNLNIYLMFHGTAFDTHGRERLRLVFSTGMAILCGDAAPSLDVAWPLVEPTVVSPKHLSWKDKMQRYRQGREAYEHAKREWKDQAEVYRLARRRMRAYRQELYRTRQQVRIEWR